MPNPQALMRWLRRIDDSTADLGQQIYYDRGHRITFQRLGVAQGRGMSSFMAFIMAFNETYSSDWAEEHVYGRVDPIVMFKNNKRTMTLAFKCPAASIKAAKVNLYNLQTLIRCLYPTYNDLTPGTSEGAVESFRVISQSPLMRINIVDLFSKDPLIAPQVSQEDASSISVDQGAREAIYSDYRDAYLKVLKSGAQPMSLLSHQANRGLLGFVKNLSINYNLEGDDGVFEMPMGSPQLVLPKLIEVNLDFTVLHEEFLGWINGKFNDGENLFGFPYGFGTERAGLEMGNRYSGSPTAGVPVVDPSAQRDIFGLPPLNGRGQNAPDDEETSWWQQKRSDSKGWLVETWNNITDAVTPNALGTLQAEQDAEAERQAMDDLDAAIGVPDEGEE